MRNLIIFLSLLFSSNAFACYDGAGSGACGWYGTSPYGEGIGYGGGNNGHNGGNNSYYSSDYYAAWNVNRYGAVTIGEFRDGTWQYFSITDKRSEKKSKRKRTDTM